MRALVVPAHGSGPEPREVPEPGPAAGRALVRVRAVALNPVDLAIASGRFYMPMPDPPYVPGAEAVGEVIASERHAPAARVWCLPMTGSLAEVVSVPEGSLVPVPDGVDDALAAAMGIAGLAGWMPVRDRGGLRAACGEGADLVVDTLWGASAPAALGALRRGGRLVQVGNAEAPAGEVVAGPMPGGRLDLRGFSVFSEEPADVAAAYRELVEAGARGLVRMAVVRVPPEQAPGAWARLAAGAGGDKLVVAG